MEVTYSRRMKWDRWILKEFTRSWRSLSGCRRDILLLPRNSHVVCSSFQHAPGLPVRLGIRPSLSHASVSRRAHCPGGPLFSHSRQKVLLVLLYLPNKPLITGVFVPGCPQNHFREDRRKIDAFCCQPVNHFSRVRRISVDGDDSVSLQLPQTVSQYVRRNSFVRFQEFLIAAKVPQHHVADNQQRPAISQNLHRRI